MQKIAFNNTVLRDGHQSLAATRMKTPQMLPILNTLDNLNFNYLETWGGAVIDSCLRYLNENPFERLKILKQNTQKTPHMMLLRGQNIVQYTSFSDDIVELFIKCAANAGVDIFRIFDALNDTRNLVTSINTVKKLNKHAQGTICYTTSPVHTLDSLINIGCELKELGVNSLCIKDMAGLITPPVAYYLVKNLKQKTGLTVTLHSHNTAGIAVASYYAAVDAGVDFIDTSITPFANGTGQPDTLLMQKLLNGHERVSNYDENKLGEIQDYLTNVYKELSSFTSHTNEKIDADILRYQVPGGMLSNFLTQLKEQKMEDKLSAVMQEVMYVREALGWIPLVTPTSQIVGTQAMLNVKFGRWKMIAAQTSDVALGKYGKTPGKINTELLQKVCEQTKLEPISCRPADILTPSVSKLREELKNKNLDISDEMVVLYAMFPQQIEALYNNQATIKHEIPQTLAIDNIISNTEYQIISSKKMKVNVNNKYFNVLVEELK